MSIAFSGAFLELGQKKMEIPFQRISAVLNA